MSAVLRVEGLTVRFGGVVAVNDVSFELQRHHILGVIGPNGAGKSTLFDAVTGFVPVASGTVLLGARDLAAMHTYQRVKLGIARTFQIERPFEDLTVLENVLIPSFLRTRRRGRAERIALDALAVVGLSDRANQFAAELNLARRRRLELARVLALDPHILLLDEIMAGLNPPALAEMIELLRELVQKGKTIVMVEHIMEAVLKLTDEVLVMANGAIIARGAAQLVMQQPEVIDAYLGLEEE